MAELLIARNPDPESSLPYLMRVPLGDGLIMRTSGTWPRTNALYCYPVPVTEWPAHPDIVERADLRSCMRRGAAIDLVVDRARESRSQLVFTKARGRDAVFCWRCAGSRSLPARSERKRGISRVVACARSGRTSAAPVSPG